MNSPVTLSVNKTFLKYFTLFLLPVDHIAWLCINPSGNYGWLYFTCKTVGKMFAPFFLLFLAEGFQHTSSRTRYRRRLLIFALISQIPYHLAVTNAPYYTENLCDTLNMGFTLFISCWALTFFETIKNDLLKWVLILLCVSLTAFSNHPLYGTALALIFFIYRDNRYKQAAGIAAIALTITLVRVLWFKFSGSDTDWQIIFYFSGIILSIPVLLIYNGNLTRPEGKYARWIDRWVFYIFYPLHFAILAVTEICLFQL